MERGGYDKWYFYLLDRRVAKKRKERGIVQGAELSPTLPTLLQKGLAQEPHIPYGAGAHPTLRVLRCEVGQGEVGWGGMGWAVSISPSDSSAPSPASSLDHRITATPSHTVRFSCTN